MLYFQGYEYIETEEVCTSTSTSFYVPYALL